MTLCSLGIKDTFHRNMLLCSGPQLLIQGEDKKNVVHVSGECEVQRIRNTPFGVDRRYMNEKKKYHPVGLVRGGEVKCERSQT
jgi:hypothetical protein